ncbi:hypothetical protein HY213_05515 [Candidatus Peregrinibacteria bacterium]|nr:hypothetical protein [Candidatus Peregrinibacteria bacterium]
MPPDEQQQQRERSRDQPPDNEATTEKDAGLRVEEVRRKVPELAELLKGWRDIDDADGNPAHQSADENWVVGKNRDGKIVVLRKQENGKYQVCDDDAIDPKHADVRAMILCLKGERYERAAMLSREQVHPFSEKKLVDSLKAIMVNGERISVDDLGQNFFRRQSISPARFELHLRNVQKAAERMEKAIKGRPGWESWKGSVRCDGLRLTATNDEKNETLFSSADRILVTEGTAMPRFSAAGEVAQMRTLDGRDVKMRKGSRYEIYDYVDEGGSTVREEQRGDGVWNRTTFNASGGINGMRSYDEHNGMPSVLKVFIDKAQVNIPVKDGSAETVTHDLPQGIYVFSPEGKPIGRYKVHREKAQAEGRTLTPQQYLDEVASALKTPEQIGKFVSSLFSLEEEGHKQREQEDGKTPNAAKTIVWTADPPVLDAYGRPTGEELQDVQHPFRTAERGKGDCEDFALFAQYLLEKIGVKSAVVRYSHNHYKCVYLEKHASEGKTTYNYCAIDTGGHYPSPEYFETAGEAIQASWSKSQQHRSGAAYELSQIEAGKIRPSREYTQQVRDAVASGGGAIVMLRPTEVHAPADGSPQSTDEEVHAYSDERYWQQIVRKS